MSPCWLQTLPRLCPQPRCCCGGQLRELNHLSNKYGTKLRLGSEISKVNIVISCMVYQLAAGQSAGRVYMGCFSRLMLYIGRT